VTFLLKPYPLSYGSAITSPNGGAAHAVADPQPKIVWECATSAGAWAIALDVDLFADRQLDTFAALFHSGPAGGLWRIYARTDAQGPSPAIFEDDEATLLFPYESWGLRPPSADGVIQETRAHALKTLAAPVGRRYLRLYFYWPGPGNFQPFRLGVLAIGKRWEPGRADGMPGFDWGAGRRVADLSEVRVLDGGERASWGRARVPEVRGSFSHLTDTEMQELWAIQRAAGEGDPMLLVEAADTLGAASLADRIHYGTFTGLDFFDRRQTSKSRAEVRLRHWL
jgi:hypothetical protein